MAGRHEHRVGGTPFKRALSCEATKFGCCVLAGKCRAVGAVGRERHVDFHGREDARLGADGIGS